MTAPTKMALVPCEPTQAMCDALVGQPIPIEEFAFITDYHAMLAASPSSGRLTAADLERAAEGVYLDRFARDGKKPAYRWRDSKWTGAEYVWGQITADARAAFAAIGLPVEGEQG